MYNITPPPWRSANGPHYFVKLQSRPILSMRSRELLEHRISNGKAGLGRRTRLGIVKIELIKN